MCLKFILCKLIMKVNQNQKGSIVNYRNFFSIVHNSLFVLVLLLKTNPSQAESSPPLPEPIVVHEGEVINKSLWIVGNKVITIRDVEAMEHKLNRLKKMSSRDPRSRASGKKLKSSKEYLIEKAIVEIAAEENTVIVSKEKIDNEIQKRMQYLGLSEKQFEKKMEREAGIPYKEWINELHYELLKKQLIQVSLNVTPPTIEEVKKFYQKNRQHIGLEISYREIVLVPHNSSFQEEARISKIATELYQKILRLESSFIEIAKTDPNNTSSFKSNGGYRPAQSIYDIASENPVLANILFSAPLKKPLRPFRDSLSRYLLVMVEKRNPLPLEKVRYLILNQMYAQKEEETFEKWINKRRREIAIKNVNH